jgi:hypothetical protein
MTQQKPTSKTTHSLPVLQPDAAGIDVHPKVMYVGVPEDRASVAVRSFGTYTPDLIKLVNWLVECKIRTVAMESTGVYWITCKRQTLDAFGHGL